MSARPGLLDQRISHFRPPSPSVSDCGNELRRQGLRVCTMEDLEIEGPKGSGPIEMKEATVSQILDEITRLNRDYRWEETHGLINIFPNRSVLDSKIQGLDVKGRVGTILAENLKIEDFGLTLFGDLEADGPSIDLNLGSCNLREALNEIVIQMGDAIWHIAGRPGAYYLTITALR